MQFRYQLTVDTGSVDGKRKQLRRRYATEKEARVALAEALGQVAAGNYVHPSRVNIAASTARDSIHPQIFSRFEEDVEPIHTKLTKSY